MRFSIACAVAMLTIGVAPAIQRRPAGNAGLYDADPNHLWNRIHRHFHVRVAHDGQEYGFDTLDPLLWRETKYLLQGASHDRAIRLLDEFLDSHGERLITDPIKRAVFQRDLWAVFDWLADEAERDPERRKTLMAPLARVIRRVALRSEQINDLPDTYRAAVDSRVFDDHFNPTQTDRTFLPGDFFNPSGSWITIGGTYPVAPQHTAGLSRSAFLVLWNVPGGASATRDYLSSLWEFPQPYVADPSFSIAKDGERRVRPNPALPMVPDGTQIALVRQMLVIDDRGRIAPTKLTESIQLRVLGKTDTFRELTLRRAPLFAGTAGGLRPTALEDSDFITFWSHGIDVFEQEPVGRTLRRNVLQGCPVCHSRLEPGILSIQSVRQLLKPVSSVDSHHDRWARYFTQPIQAADFKTRRYDWGLLQGLWNSSPW